MSFRRPAMYQLGIETGPMVPTDLYPPANVPLQDPPSASEREVAAQFYKFQAEVRDGPLYTGSVEVKTGPNGQKKASRILIEVDDACDDGIRRYTDRYRKKRKVGRSIDEHPYILELFPQELHEAMGAKKEAGEDVKRRRAGISKFANSLIQADEADLSPVELEARLKAQQALTMVDDKELEARLGQEAADSEEEEIEDDVYDDEDDNDYNAEGYFDNGDEDDDDGDDDEANF
ncbi:DNA-directed RNA polymerase III, subunit Rpc31 [Yarrowia lipolytica]|uniref:DNA-directed RNA polymerase III subunit n=2 Tax=Yarrowia lipolytica TaxID=4952 RepID=Q6C9W5_YARLI|nr:YALI0D07788p [Yarrowia lipolytica CLIB122]AOW03749.1 hypothetical protein YALI1_D10033g [Yarrowia lipolytica]KAB8284343.1 DNA-directed RNA polymerase III, subunit Rpc31 [Yarrowia lipolytica]KAE8172681.1 DNA-directed RNA polymerase III, subunit Rpc31 [Yarrowia lipolytica]KAJ8054660.1 DNA-directed RNA polymerase III, subunit Rpc31 [Yarrowia lipolytica]QNP97705.1 DNA-directed RNA polymerase III subunit RPC7 [Yarrowia lipolytica]|eukprot:XP_502547.1 YALI0D07788p [Yarrowia lipolytica CLIB122]